MGMSRQDVESAHPGKQVVLSASCRAQFSPVFVDNQLQAIRLKRYTAYNDCGRQVYAALLQKYGLPSSTGSAGYISLWGIADSHDFYWVSEGRAIKLRLLEDGRFAELSYLRALDLSLEGVGLSL